MSTHLSHKRVLILGAETEIGRAVTSAVAEAGASVAAVAATSESEAAFAVQRLARHLSSGERKVIAQAIDATNEAAVRVMVRQVSKELGGLDVVVVKAEPSPEPTENPAKMLEWLNVFQHLLKFGEKEMQRSGGGNFFVVMRSGFLDTPSSNVQVLLVEDVSPEGIFQELSPEEMGARVVRAIAGEPESG